MANISHGMNIEAIERIGRNLQIRHAAEVQGLVAEIEGMINDSPRIWTGPKADTFRSWWPAKRTKMLAIAEDLHGFGQSALNNASEQRQASEARGGSARSAAGFNSTATNQAPVVPGADASPAESALWWAGLSEAEQEAVLRDDPSTIGNLDGIPHEARYEANRLAIEAELMRELTSGSAEFDDLAKLALYVQILEDPNRNILLFDPAGDGRIAEVFGDLSAANDIAIVVPGIGNDLNKFDGAEASRLYGVQSGRMATIQWLGYDPPTGPFELDSISDSSAFSPERAQEWASSLTDFTEGLKLTTDGEISVVAHSYGTVLATEAAKDGMQVDRVVLLGSPGISADTSDVFNGAEVFAIRNSSDHLVPLGSVHGTDPTHPEFGATVLPGSGGHSSYFDAESVSLEGIRGAVERLWTIPSADGSSDLRTEIQSDGTTVISETARF